MILGSSLIEEGRINHAFAEQMAVALGREKLVFAVDAKRGTVAIRGWRERTPILPRQMVEALDAWCDAFLYTHVDTEGMMQGIPKDIVRTLCQATRRQMIVAGGISSREEIEELEAMGADAVVGMALYLGRLVARKLSPGPLRRPHAIQGLESGPSPRRPGSQCGFEVQVRLASLRLPLIQEVQQELRGKRTGSAKLVVLLGKKNLTLAIEHDHGRNAAIQRYLIAICHILILVVLADVDVHDQVVAPQHGGEIGSFKRQLQNVAVIAPVRSKDEQHMFAVDRGFAQGLSDFLLRIDARGVDLSAGRNRLFQPAGIGSLQGHQAPKVPLLLPDLCDVDIEGLRPGTGRVDLGRKHELPQAGLGACGLNHPRLQSPGLQA